MEILTTPSPTSDKIGKDKLESIITKIQRTRDRYRNTEKQLQGQRRRGRSSLQRF